MLRVALVRHVRALRPMGVRLLAIAAAGARPTPPSPPTSSAPTSDPVHAGLPDTLVAKDVIFKNKISYLREQLAADTRFRMPIAEFEQLLAANEVSLEDGRAFLKGLHMVGLVLYYEQQAPDWIYLRPRAITRELLHMLDPDGAVSSALMRNKAADLAKLEAEYAALSETKQVLDARALRKGHRWTYGVMAAVTLQGLIMARLIWWDLSWDVMEPIAYLIGFTYMTFGWAYFVIARDDIAEYGTVAGKYVANAKNKLYSKAAFSQEAYDALREKIALTKRNLKAYGVVPLAERKNYPIPHGVLRESILEKEHAHHVEEKLRQHESAAHKAQ